MKTDFLIVAYYRDLTEQSAKLCEFAVEAEDEADALAQARAIEPVLKRCGWMRVEEVTFDIIDIQGWLKSKKAFYQFMVVAQKAT